MLKKLKGSLTLRIFLITSAFMLAACAITYGAIAYLTPISYTSLLTDELESQSITLVHNLSQGTASESEDILQEFARQTGADMRLIDEAGEALYDTLPQTDVMPAVSVEEGLVGGMTEDDAQTANADARQALIVEALPDAPHGAVPVTDGALTTQSEDSLQAGTAYQWALSMEEEVPEDLQGVTYFADEPMMIQQVVVVEDKNGFISGGTYPLSFSDGMSGTLMVQGGRRAINQASQAMARLLPFLVLVVLAISLLGAFFYARLITHPIVSISHIARRMASMDFDARWDKTRADEIGVLGDSVNLLSDNLSGALGELQSANQGLQNDIERERELDRQRLTFFSAASHELKTPVTILKGQLSGMLAQVGIYRDREKYLARALEVTGRMEGLIKEILTISRIESSSFALQAVPVDLSALMRTQLSLDEELIQQRGIALEIAIDPGVTVKGNESLLISALDNVLMNAILYSPPGASIRIEVHERMLSVENCGVSIPEEALAQLFAPFYRVEQSRNRKSGGSGLGLYLVKSILKLHGASCCIENTAQGVRFVAQFA